MKANMQQHDVMMSHAKDLELFLSLFRANPLPIISFWAITWYFSGPTCSKPNEVVT